MSLRCKSAHNNPETSDAVSNYMVASEINCVVVKIVLVQCRAVLSQSGT